MKKFSWSFGTLPVFAVMILFSFFICSRGVSTSAELTFPSTVKIFFSPHGGTTAAVVSEINSATEEILVQAYSFTSAPIAKALVNAKKRGVHVEVVLDKSQMRERYTEADFLSRAGVPTFIDRSHSIAHNKIMIIDRQTVITGSFNFTKAAEEKNAENLMIIKDNSVALVTSYLKNYSVHKNHSFAYVK